MNHSTRTEKSPVRPALREPSQFDRGKSQQRALVTHLTTSTSAVMSPILLIHSSIHFPLPDNLCIRRFQSQLGLLQRLCPATRDKDGGDPLRHADVFRVDQETTPVPGCKNTDLRPLECYSRETKTGLGFKGSGICPQRSNKPLTNCMDSRT